MTIVPARAAARRTRELLASTLGAVLLLLALTLPAFGAPIGPTKLESADVDPRTTDTATPIAFTVTYRNAHDLPPDYVRVNVAGTTYAMSGAGTAWKAGVVFTVRTTIPAGTHAVRFEARDTERFIDALEAGSVVVGAPTPTPTPTPPTPTPTPTPPTPTPTPTPTPAPTPAPTPTPPPTPTTTPTSPAPAPTPAPGSTPSPSPTPTPAGSGSTSGPGSTSGGGGTGSASGTGDRAGLLIGDGSTGWTDDGGTWSPDSAGSDDRSGLLVGDGSAGWTGDWSPSSPGGGTTPGSVAPGGGASTAGNLPWFAAPGGTVDPAVPAGPDDGAGTTDAAGSRTSGPGRSTLNTLGDWLFGPFDDELASLGISGPGRLATIPAAVGSTAAVATWMAFSLFSKRRRDADPVAPDDVLNAAAATGFSLASVPMPVAPVDPEASMPRWRRPSLLEARRTDPIRTPAAPRPRLAFGTGPGEAVRSERRVVRYAFSPLLDRPDEIRGARIGDLVAGDEVEVRERSGAYCLVLCPDGREGWIHRMTLGDVVASESTTRWGVDTTVEPEAENALAALLAARGMR